MSKLDDAYNRLDRYEHLLRKGHALTSALLVYQDEGANVPFEAPVTALCDDIKRVLGAVEDRDDYRERLRDLVMIDGEEAAIGGGPGFKDRAAKAWDRAREPFEP